MLASLLLLFFYSTTCLYPGSAAASTKALFARSVQQQNHDLEGCPHLTSLHNS